MFIINSIRKNVDIIDNLTTTIKGRALDASQGKILKDMMYPAPYRGNGRYVNVRNAISDLVGLGFSLQNVFLLGQNLSNLNLIDSNFSNATIEYSNLTSTIFYAANLKGTNFVHANLQYANFLHADLTNANLHNANLYAAILALTILNGANLSDAGLENATGLDPDINVALEFVNKDPNADGLNWFIEWTDGNIFKCNPATGLFSQL